MAEKADIWRSPAVQRPSTQQLKALSDKLGLECTDSELVDIKAYIDDNVLECYQRVNDLVEPRLPVKYPRTPGYRPRPEDNKCNAWYWRCDIAGAPEGKLQGKTIGIKDSICVAGVPMMIGTKQLEGYVPDEDAIVVTRILDAGGHVVGKTNCENLCCDGNSYTSDLGPTLNPHNPLHSAGGSSSGSAVAVASGDVDMALGGDQGGSVRYPAGWCGIVGMKATWGLVPYTGAAGVDLTLDHLGPMARTVTDCALLLEVIAGYADGLDPRQTPNMVVPDYSRQLEGDLQGKKAAIVNEGFQYCDDDVIEYVRKAAESLVEAGIQVEEISIPQHNDGASIWIPIAFEGGYKTIVQENGAGCHFKGHYSHSIQDAFAKGCRGRPQQYAVSCKVAWLVAEYINTEHQNKFYTKAQNLGRLLTQAYNKALEKYDVLIMPTMPYKAPPLPLKGSSLSDRLMGDRNMIFNCAPFDVTGHPALTINVGFSEGLPIGMMIVGRHFDETTVLQVARGYEKLRDYKEKSSN